MILKKGIPTLQHMVTKKYSRPDNIFVTNGLTELITKCDVAPDLHPQSTDHFPILTILQLHQSKMSDQPLPNFKMTDWTAYKTKLQNKINKLRIPQQLRNSEQIRSTLDALTQTIQETTQETVPQLKPRPDYKRWWNKDLSIMKKKLNRLQNISFKFRAFANHPSHLTLKLNSNRYGEAIIQAKRKHWENYLEEMTTTDIWTANKYIKEPSSDGGAPRIPSLKTVNNVGTTTITSRECRGFVNPCG